MEDFVNYENENYGHEQIQRVCENFPVSCANGDRINAPAFPEENYFVYKHKNLSNGKVYYGIAQDCKQRWNNGSGYGSNAYFYREILYYGWSNFSHEILFANLSKDKAVLIESLLIQETKSYLEEYGYNINYTSIIFDTVDCELNSVRTVTRRSGRNGTPVVYDGKYYSTIKMLAEEIEEEAIIISNALNPNVSMKIPKRLAEKGLRYATQEEIEENS